MKESLFQKQDASFKYCRILTPSHRTRRYTVFKTVTWIGEGALGQTRRMALFKRETLSLNSPELVLDWFRKYELSRGEESLMSDLPVLHDFTDELVDCLDDLKALSNCLLIPNWKPILKPFQRLKTTSGKKLTP